MKNKVNELFRENDRVKFIKKLMGLKVAIILKPKNNIKIKMVAKNESYKVKYSQIKEVIENV